MKDKARQGEARQRLFKAAIDVFNKQGFAAASTKQIIQKAKLSKPTLYYYYKNKENLYREIIRDIFNRFNDQLSVIASRPDHPLKKLVQVASLYLDNAGGTPRKLD